MNILTGLGASGMIVWRIVVPLFRFISSMFFAFAIAKDCKSRNNGSSPLWGLCAFISPLIAGVIYWIYSRYCTTRVPVTENDLKLAKQSKKLLIAAVFFYILTAVLFVGSVIITVAALFASELSTA